MHKHKRCIQTHTKLKSNEIIQWGHEWYQKSAIRSINNRKKKLYSKKKKKTYFLSNIKLTLNPTN